MKGSFFLFLTLTLTSTVFAQQHNWQHLDLVKDGIFGMSTDRAYQELLQNKKPKQVVVAVIDSGIDTAQTDLKDVLWTNAGEIPGNGIDDDKNGYIDDIHGWNYLGSELGKEDLVKLIAPKKDFYDSLSYTVVPESERANYQAYRKILNEYNGHVYTAEAFMADLQQCSDVLNKITQKIGKEEPTLEDFKQYKPNGELEAQVVKIVLNRLARYCSFEQFRNCEVEELLEKLRFHIQNGLSLEGSPRPAERTSRLGQSSRKVWGDGMVSNEVLGLVTNPNTSSFHGTHVAGIIAASRHNNEGMDGVADNVRIMTLKLMSNIRELRDENLALAIRYAADNGAKVINLSFGKPFSYGKTMVDQAVKYAMSKDVLIVHAAGNTGEDLDDIGHFPNSTYADGSGKAEAWIEVGASGPKNDNSLMASFSNYGSKSVDVFAPGIQIYSCLPGSTYSSLNGTSMAAPQVAGLAALIREYYPMLRAIEVKDIILKSVIVSPFLNGKCLTSGVVNAYNALKLAESYGHRRD